MNKNKIFNLIQTDIVHTKDLKVVGDILYLPLYMAIFL